MIGETEQRLDLLESRLAVDLSLDDLRILVGNFRALEYLMKLEGTSYLDADGLNLRHRLEDTYREALLRLGVPAVSGNECSKGGIGL